MFLSKSNFKKAAAILVLNCFLFSISADCLSQAAAFPALSANNNTNITGFQHIFQSKILIPSSYGKITNVQDAQSDTVIVNIQDLHSHGATQRNIAKIIEIIDSGYNLNGVYSEGGISSIDVSWINQIQDKELREKLINNLVDEGDLTAGEFYYMTRNAGSALKGIEDKNIHIDNIIRLAGIEAKMDQYSKIAEEINKEIEVLNKIYTNRRNIRFNKLLNAYSKGKINEAKLYAVINKYIKAINANPEKYNHITKIKTEDYPNIKFYMEMNKLSSKINNTRTAQELQSLLLLMKERISYGEYSNLLTYTENFSNTEKLVEVLGGLSEKYSSDLTANFHNINMLIEINKLVNKLNPVELITEQRRLTESIKMALSYNDTEAEITFISDFKDYFKNYITASLSKEDWEYAKSRINKFISIYEKYSGSYNINEIKPRFAELNKYYDVNTNRDNIFISNLDVEQSPANAAAHERSAADIIKAAKEVKIIITGGYHSKGLQENLSAKNISTITITPTVTGDISAANKKYNGIVQKQGKVFSQALAALMASSSTPLAQKALLIEAGVRMFGVNSPELSFIINALTETDILVEENKIVISFNGETAEVEFAGKEAIPLESISENIKNITVSAADLLATLFNTNNPLQNITDIEYKILKTISSALFENGIYFSKGAVKEVEQAGYLGKDLDGIGYDTYKYFPAVVQNMLLEYQTREDSKVELSDAEKGFFTGMEIAVPEGSELFIQTESGDKGYLIWRNKKSKGFIDEQIRMLGAPSQNLTMAWLEKIFTKFNFSKAKRDKWLLAIETPLMVLGISLPFIQKLFLSLHKKADRAMLERALTEINDLTREAFKTARSNIKFPVIKQIADLAVKIQAAFRTNAALHLSFNNTGRVVKKYTDMLSGSEELTSDDPADFILICGNDNINTFRKALEYYKTGAAKKIIISGGFGRLTIPVLKEAASLGLEVQISENETIRNIEDYQKFIESLKNDNGEIDDAKRKERIKISEAQIIEIILKHFDANGTLKAADLILDNSARFTAENFTNETVKSAIEKHFRETGKTVRFAYIQTPLQQLRTKGTFNGAFAEEIKQSKVEGISVTIPYENKNLEQEAETIAAELLRIIIYSAKGDVALLLNEMPENALAEVADLIESLSNSEQIKNAFAKFMSDSMPLFKSEEDFLNRLERSVDSARLSAVKQFINSLLFEKRRQEKKLLPSITKWIFSILLVFVAACSVIPMRQSVNNLYKVPDIVQSSSISDELADIVNTFLSDNKSNMLTKEALMSMQLEVSEDDMPAFEAAYSVYSDMDFRKNIQDFAEENGLEYLLNEFQIFRIAIGISESLERGISLQQAIQVWKAAYLQAYNQTVFDENTLFFNILNEEDTSQFSPSTTKSLIEAAGVSTDGDNYTIMRYGEKTKRDILDEIERQVLKGIEENRKVFISIDSHGNIMKADNQTVFGIKLSIGDEDITNENEVIYDYELIDLFKKLSATQGYNANNITLFSFACFSHELIESFQSANFQSPVIIVGVNGFGDLLTILTYPIARDKAVEPLVYPSKNYIIDNNIKGSVTIGDIINAAANAKLYHAQYFLEIKADRNWKNFFAGISLKGETAIVGNTSILIFGKDYNSATRLNIKVSQFLKAVFANALTFFTLAAALSLLSQQILFLSPLIAVAGFFGVIPLIAVFEYALFNLSAKINKAATNETEITFKDGSKIELNTELDKNALFKADTVNNKIYGSRRIFNIYNSLPERHKNAFKLFLTVSGVLTHEKAHLNGANEIQAYFQQFINMLLPIIPIVKMKANSITAAANTVCGILPKTMESIVEPMIAAGNSTLKIAWKVALAEFLPLLNPFKSIKGHKDEGLGAIIGSAAASLSGYLTFLGAVLIFAPLSLTLPFAIPVFIIAVVAGSLVKIGLHLFIDAKYIKKLKISAFEEMLTKVGNLLLIRQLEGENLADIISFVNGNALNQNVSSLNRKLLAGYIERQFKEKSKGITELISNAIDARKEQVSISVKEDSIIIENDGEQGISLQTVITNLINTANSTKTDKAEQIGRFGLGFFSALNLLNSDEDLLEIVSIRDNGSFKFTIEVRYDVNGNRQFYIKEIISFSTEEAQNESSRLGKTNGTSIKIQSKDIDNNKFIDTIKQDFAHSFVKIDLYNGNDEEPIKFQTNTEDFEIISSDNTDLNICFDKEIVETPGKGKLAVVIKGVTFFEAEVLGANARKNIIVNLPNDLDFSISRDSITIDKRLVNYVNTLVNSVKDSDKSFAEKMSLLNSLYVMCEHFEMQKTDFVKSTILQTTAKQLINEALKKAEDNNETLFIVADSIENYEFFGVNNKMAVLVNPNLLEEPIYQTADVEFEDIIGYAKKVLVVNFNEIEFDKSGEYNRKDIIRIGDIIVINKTSERIFEDFPVEMRNAFINAIDDEIVESHERVSTNKSAKFYDKKEYKKLVKIKKDYTVLEHDISSIAANKGSEIKSGAVSKLMQEVLGVENIVKLTNEVSQTIHDLGQGEGIFIRELLKNSIEAESKKLDIKVNEKDGVLAITDNGLGMDFQQITNKLLIPKATDKTGINNFGTGIFSAFNENMDKLVIRTTQGGISLLVELYPVVNADGRVTDISYAIYESNFKSFVSGTTVEFYYKEKNSQYLSRNIFKNLEALNETGINITVNDEIFTQKKEKINKPYGLEDSIINLYFSNSGQSFITAGGFFIKDINVDFLVNELGIAQNADLFEMLKYLAEYGVIVDLPAETLLLLNKQDFIIDIATKELIIKHLTDAFVKLYMRQAGNNRTIIKEIPYDYLHWEYAKDNEIIGNHTINGNMSFAGIKYCLININKIFTRGITPKLISGFKSSQDKTFIKQICNDLYNSVPGLDNDGIKSEHLYELIINSANDTNELKRIMEGVRKEIMYYTVQYLLQGDTALIQDYSLIKMANIIMQENTIDTLDDGRYYSHTDIFQITENMARTNANVNTVGNAVNILEKAEDSNISNLTHAKERLLNSPYEDDYTGKGKTEKLDLMYVVIRFIVNGIITACFGENSGININVDFDFNTSWNASAWAGGNTITINMADQTWYNYLFVRDAFVAIWPFFILEHAGTLFHEITHLLEDKNKGTHNKAFYDLERYVMAQFVNNANGEDFSNLRGFQNTYNWNLTMISDDYISVIEKIWGKEAALAAIDKMSLKPYMRRAQNEIILFDDDIDVISNSAESSDVADLNNVSVSLTAQNYSDINLKKISMSFINENIFISLIPQTLSHMQLSKDAIMNAVKNFSSILPENQEAVNNMLAAGKSPLLVSLFIAVKEFFKSLMPVKFTMAHAAGGQSFTQTIKTNTAPFIVSLSGYTAFTLFLSGALLFAPMAVPLAIAFSAFVGSASNIITHIVIDYKYLKSFDLAEVGKQYGNAKIVNLKNYTVYVVNDVIAGEATGISIDGVPVRISKINNSIVVSANGIEYERIVKAINNTKALKAAVSNAAGVNNGKVEISSIIADNGNEKGIRFENDLIKVGYKDLLDYTLQTSETFGKYAAALSKIKREHRNAIIDKFIYLLNGNAKEALQELLNQNDNPNIKLAVSANQYNKLKDIIKEIKVKGIEIFILSEQNIQSENFEFTDGLITNGQLIYADNAKEYSDVLLIEKIDENFNSKVLEYNGMLLMDIAAIKEYSQGSDIVEINGLFNVMSGIMSMLAEYAIGDISLRDIKKMLPALIENIEIKDEILNGRIKKAAYNKNLNDFIEAIEGMQNCEAVIIYLKDASVSQEKKAAVMESINNLLFAVKVDIKADSVNAVRSMQTYRSILSAA